MRLGVMALATDRTMPPAELAVAVEERGLRSLFLPEHTHIPASRQTPYPGGEPLKDEYYRFLDPLVALSMAAAVTERIELGTGVLLVNQHDPIALAKAIATLDHLSGGRFVLGAGFGWNEDEMSHHGVDPRRRRTVFREKMLAMIELWENELASFDGTHVSFSPSYQWPKPARRPHPPVLLGGGAGPVFFKHLAEYADGWLPIGGKGLKDDIAAMRDAAAEAGRDPAELSINLFGVFPDRGRLEHYRELGADRVALALPPAKRFTDVEGATADVILPILDEYAVLAEQLHD
ncbi:LLM class F420-dependent oxidoreductase [Cumulibacter manganitolerans]|uniref:LLM class F420-dependent oxidoreductase n=1 Tax=Cumulibacter manganitolerans TaxID=1884992 RepID=UPI001295CA0B|nr:LLM class F420-dependent oxidoreductase [Cumulibacter manganitolerans]